MFSDCGYSGICGDHLCLEGPRLGPRAVGRDAETGTGPWKLSSVPLVEFVPGGSRVDINGVVAVLVLIEMHVIIFVLLLVVLR